MELTPVIEIVKDKCVNCHQCIAACPVKFANNGSEDVISLNHELCIGCSECIHACTHNARIIIDDFEKASDVLFNRTHKSVAIIAPAIAAVFPDTYLNFNGWLKSLGVEAVFDVSFGAELTVKSYIEHIKTNNPVAVIAQPCPAIVTYIQIYKPSLLPHLAPADSPMMHTVKMVKKYFPQYAGHKVMVISPCIAKRREFDETGLADYNVTFSRIIQYLEDQKIDLARFAATQFDNPPAERAVLFSTPGGLLQTAQREVPSIADNTRKIEGVHAVYKYLDQLEHSIALGKNPLLIDCLNCHLGCNGGSGTPHQDAEQDILEHAVNHRKNKQVSHYANKTTGGVKAGGSGLKKSIDAFWEKGIYSRSYKNHSANYKRMVKMPNDEQLKTILTSMAKFDESDLKNCASCGYNSCKEMAKAIFNNYNRKENCHFFLDYNIKQQNEQVRKRTHELIDNSEELLQAMLKIKDLIEN
jgi:iron only hydrogenase large subunit-like protein